MVSCFWQRSVASVFPDGRLPPARFLVDASFSILRSCHQFPVAATMAQDEHLFRNVGSIVYESPRGEIVEPTAMHAFKVLIQITPWGTHPGVRGSFQARDGHFVGV